MVAPAAHGSAGGRWNLRADSVASLGAKRGGAAARRRAARTTVGPTFVGDRSGGRMCPARPAWGRIRWRVTIATSRFSRTNGASIRSMPGGTGPRPWLLVRRMPAGRQRPQVREKYPAPQKGPSRAIAALKWAISRHAAAKALALASLTSNSPSSSLTCVASARDDQRRYRSTGSCVAVAAPGRLAIRGVAGGATASKLAVGGARLSTPAQKTGCSRSTSACRASVGS
jgi:hypothetical protein